ncbi:MAG: M23 family metallopeptidase [Ardenticatenaceae bacterium]|nr:M23 family metallopeptidase [Anaerolineales bacterium]MCB8941714.1 M23 family metallopeptidase [Ardenticatenaceae bacterium]MCB8972825.1 M23 family metallopeptidase [Ardenticatenaceae bacterium]
MIGDFLVANLQSPISNLLLVTAVFLLLTVSACQPAAVESAVPVAAAVANVAPTPTLEPALAQPIIEYSEPPPAAEMPSFSLSKPEDEVPESVGVATAVATAPPAPETATAIPSPTPPHLRYTSPDEHYWFWRPIREGETNWTDKVYPYGGTRGGTLRPHHGVEFYVPAGTEVMAVADGTIIYAGSDDGQMVGPEPNFYGNVIIIEHDARLDGQPVYTLYGHLTEPLVQEGQHVFMQQVIALSGATGVADGAHLHFEVRVGENSYNHTRNPRLWLYPFPDKGTVVGRVVNSAGELLDEVTITLSSTDGANLGHTTTTYAGNDAINSDPLWSENFAIDDVGNGGYKAVVQIGDVRVTEVIVVRPYQTTFVQLVIDPPPPTPTPTPEP